MRRHKRRVDLNLDIAPINLIDLLLVLLVFFITTTTFLQLKVIELNLPTATSQVSKYKKNKTVVINVNQECEVYINAKLQDKALLVEKLKSLKEEDSKNIFQVGADAKSEHHCVVDVLDALMQANISNISILTKEKKD